MRLQQIEEHRRALSNTRQTLDPHDISDEMTERFRLNKSEPLRRKILRRVAPALLTAQQPFVPRLLKAEFHKDKPLFSLGERYAFDTSLQRLLDLTTKERVDTVLVPGCFLGSEDVQFWARRGVAEIQGIDVYCLSKAWTEAIASFKENYTSRVEFRQATIEDMPFEDEKFDLIFSSAVLEHVRNVPSMINETARVLRPGGLAWHQFGPLYFSHSGDHCIAAYGWAKGYDHLLLDDVEYSRLISDEAFFNASADKNMTFWAVHDQFSFLRLDEYLRAFEERFCVEHLVLKISPEAMRFRDTYPELWRRLLDAGLRESDLLIKSACVILRKRPDSQSVV